MQVPVSALLIPLPSKPPLTPDTHPPPSSTPRPRHVLVRRPPVPAQGPLQRRRRLRQHLDRLAQAVRPPTALCSSHCRHHRLIHMPRPPRLLAGLARASSAPRTFCFSTVRAAAAPKRASRRSRGSTMYGSSASAWVRAIESPTRPLQPLALLRPLPAPACPHIPPPPLTTAYFPPPTPSPPTRRLLQLGERHADRQLLDGCHLHDGHQGACNLPLSALRSASMLLPSFPPLSLLCSPPPLTPLLAPPFTIGHQGAPPAGQVAHHGHVRGHTGAPR